jgi:hypothetical protein
VLLVQVIRRRDGDDLCVFGREAVNRIEVIVAVTRTSDHGYTSSVSTVHSVAELFVVPHLERHVDDRTAEGVGFGLTTFVPRHSVLDSMNGSIEIYLPVRVGDLDGDYVALLRNAEL